MQLDERCSEAHNALSFIFPCGLERDTVNEVLGLRVGELVEVKSEEEILRTLDSRGTLESMPFMPEMVRFCGKRFRVYKRAHKACDTIGWKQLRRMENAVHLENLRCDGGAHGGCQAGCLIYWEGGMAEARPRAFYARRIDRLTFVHKRQGRSGRLRRRDAPVYKRDASDGNARSGNCA